ncbi:protein SPA1-RELATED 2-like [Primulina tabacum]|uniref:protein SPA1-RELATED 2-like n=1 Tax=Primulina tabacum TaxID=48773 RepID=UPI003F5A9728
MDEAVSDAMAEPVGTTHIRNKENEFSLKSSSSSGLESNEMAMPRIDDYPENLKNPSPDISYVKFLDRIGSSNHASASPHCMDDAGVMVEELTLKNYDGEKMAIVGTSNNRNRMQTRRNQWQHLYQVAGGSGVNSWRGQSRCKEKDLKTEIAWEDRDKNLFCELLDKREPKKNSNCKTFVNDLLSSDNKVSTSEMCSSGTVRTRFLSKSGFSDYLKSTLRGKGVIHKSPVCKRSSVKYGDHDHPKTGNARLTDSVIPLGSTAAAASPLSHDFSEPWICPNSDNVGDGISFRDWLETGKSKVDKVESLRIFKQVLDLVDLAHSRRSFLQDLRPSCFKLVELCQILYIGSSAHLGVKENANDQEIHLSNLSQTEMRSIHLRKPPSDSQSVKKRKLGENPNVAWRWPQYPSRSSIIAAPENVVLADNAAPKDPSNDFAKEHIPKTESNNKSLFFGLNVPTSSQQLQASVSCMLEKKWYSSPEQFNDNGCTIASNIYSLGVLLFELQCSFDSGRSRAAAMLDLRHRILPPSFLSESPKEAGFCLWLLHPEPSLRPTTREILQSEFISGIKESSGDKFLSSIDEEKGKSELLLSFLSSLNDVKQKDESNLVEQIQQIEADIEEVEKRRPKKSPVLSPSPGESLSACDKETRSTNNIKQIESAYFSMRPSVRLSASDVATQRYGELLGKNEAKGNTTDYLGGFFDGLCKYARYSNFKVQGILRLGDYNNSPNVICSLSFDRDEDYLATAGVSKKIKVFGFQALFDESVDIHYPVIEMENKSKLSCICWNSYISNYLASTDYDGTVKLWDATTGQSFSHFSEHTERAWSVDFSRVDPLKLASGSDDRSVKLWSINEKNSLTTIKNHANVCCVQFSSDSPHLLAFSSADYKTFCYDVRNISTPWCILAGHEKAVSYTKFLDATTLVTASTDNTLKIWNLNKTSSNSISRNACVSTLRGHTNEKNFVGLSVADGYITCGSETNEVFAYYRSLPVPITSHKFGSIDQITGKETEESNGQFISSVCWRRKSNMVVAANSSGCIKLLHLV